MSADYEIQPSSEIDLNTGKITVEIKNTGNAPSTTYNGKNYHRVFEVTTDINKAVAWDFGNNVCHPHTPLYYEQNGVITTYYQKGPRSGYPGGDLHLNIEDFTYSGGSGTSYSGDVTINNSLVNGNNLVYVSLTSSPALEAGDSVKFIITGDFKKGKTYMFAADDFTFNTNCAGDTEGSVSGAPIQHNNSFFVFTYRNYAAEAAERAALEARRLRHRDRIRDRTWQKSFFPPGRNVSVANQYHHHQMSKRAIAALGIANSTSGNTVIKKHRVGNSKPRTENGVSAAARQPRAFQQCSSIRSRSRPHHGRLISIGNGGILTPSARAVGSMDRLARLKAAAMGGTKNWKK